MAKKRKEDSEVFSKVLRFKPKYNRAFLIRIRDLTDELEAIETTILYVKECDGISIGQRDIIKNFRHNSCKVEKLKCYETISNLIKPIILAELNKKREKIIEQIEELKN